MAIEKAEYPLLKASNVIQQVASIVHDKSFTSVCNTKGTALTFCQNPLHLQAGPMPEDSTRGCLTSLAQGDGFDDFER